MRIIGALFVLCVIVGMATQHKGDVQPATAAATTATTPAAAPAKKEPPPPPPTPKPGEEVTEEFFKYFVDGEVMVNCDYKIKPLVKYEIRTPGLMWGTNSGDSAFLYFDRWSRTVGKDNTILIAGDRAEAQNGFGNWIKVNYSCRINLATKKAVYGTLDNGRLP
jgi:hypothetical protein